MASIFSSNFYPKKQTENKIKIQILWKYQKLQALFFMLLKMKKSRLLKESQKKVMRQLSLV